MLREAAGTQPRVYARYGTLQCHVRVAQFLTTPLASPQKHIKELRKRSDLDGT